MNLAQLTGQNETALVNYDGYLLHADVVSDWAALQRDAAQAGFDLAIASAYRSFSRQLLIWNEKATGVRPVFDDEHQVLDAAQPILMLLSLFSMVFSLLLMFFRLLLHL